VGAWQDGAGPFAYSGDSHHTARHRPTPPGSQPEGTLVPQLEPGQTAPDFTLTAADGSNVALCDYRGRSVIVYFYPAAMTPGCTKQACDFRDSLDALQASGYAVLGISPDKPARLATFVERDGLTFPLLSDPDRGVLEAWGAWGEKSLYGKTVTGVIRSTIVVDPEGVVQLARYNVKATGHVASLRKALGI
jgi:thioredoxin-dependent peroxiredoxin